MTPAARRAQKIQSLFADPRVEFRPVQRSLMTYARRLLGEVLRALGAVDSRFARGLGAYVTCRVLWQSLGWQPWAPEVQGMTHTIAGGIAAVIFVAWICRVVADTHAALAVEGRLVRLITVLRSVGLRKLRRKNRTSTFSFVLPYSEIPSKHKPAVLESLAQMAYNRWTGNATFESRVQFFRHLVARFPEGVRVGLEYDEDRRVLQPCGYSAIVPLGIESYRKHLFGKANLFDQDETFLLSTAGVESRVLAYNGAGALDREKDGMAIYILGMNVRGGCEKSHGKQMFRALKVQLRQMLRLFPTRKPYLYCATTIPSVMKNIQRNGFVYHGNHEAMGNKLYERDLTDCEDAEDARSARALAASLL